jgi:hypothetical protein
MVSESRRIRFTGNAGCIEDITNARKNLVRNPVEKKPFRIPRRRSKHTTEMDFYEE